MTVIEWKVDPSHTSVSFGVRHMMVSTVRGHFQNVSGTVSFDAEHPENSQASLVVDIKSIDTREPKRDDHLRSADFFDAEKYPSMTFRSTRVTKTTDGGFDLAGDLTIKDVTKPITFHVDDVTAERADPWGGVRMGASAKAKLKRSDYGMTWNAALEAGGIVVGDEVKIELDVELERAK